jgi:hypothetical protein
MRRVVLTIVSVLVVLAVIAGIGYVGFTWGAQYGISQSPQIAAAIENMPEGGLRPDGPGAPFAPGLDGRFGYGWGGPHMGFGGMHGGFGPGMGFGFGFLRCLIPLFFLFLLFGLLRFVFRPWRWGGGHWGGWRGGPGGQGPWGHGVPPHFEEWHKRAHGEAPATPNDPNAPPPTNA